jgi:hypothetical protein
MVEQHSLLPVIAGRRKRWDIEASAYLALGAQGLAEIVFRADSLSSREKILEKGSMSSPRTAYLLASK